MADRVSWLKRWVAYPVEAAIVQLCFRLLGAFPIDTASALGGRIAQMIGPHLKVSDRARRNLRRAFPDLPPERIEEIVRGVWNNLGRVAAEYPHLREIEDRIELVGVEHIHQALARGRPIIFFSAHIANWETSPLAVVKLAAPLNLLYRPVNNAWVDEIVHRYRRKGSPTRLIPKGAEGAKQLLRVLADGQHVGILLDQKMNDGLPVPFFGRDAMTAPAAAQLALKFDCTILPARIERLDGARFRQTIYPPLELPRTGNRKADALAIMTRINAIIEDWVRQRPEQWLWLHRRWPD